VLRWTLPALASIAARHGWQTITAIEEPFSWIAAASHIGVARAAYRNRLAHPLARRSLIAAAYASLLLAPSRRAGVALYLAARRRRGEPS
jgi:hypothetical protein